MMDHNSGTAGQGGSGGSGLSPNIASFLCYFCPPITSLLFLFLERDNKDVRFHAWQGTLFGGGWMALVIVLEILSHLLGMLVGFLGTLIVLLVPLIWLASLVIWLMALVKAFRGEQWRIPYLGDIAAKKAGL